MEPITFTARKHLFPTDASVDFGLQLVGSLAVHSLTTMPMLPWVVAEVRRLSGQSSRKEPGTKQVRLAVSPSGLRCEPEPGKSQQWDPLICSSIFECKPQHVHKLIHNSHDPSYFACLIKDKAAHQQSICYVFKADDQTKVSGGGDPKGEGVAGWLLLHRVRTFKYLGIKRKLRLQLNIDYVTGVLVYGEGCSIVLKNI